MKKLKLYQIDAFADKLFSGNPAAVCILDKWIADDLMQSIGEENNLAETVFVVPREDDFEIRWFTPTTEVDLCGHATLAAAYVLFEILDYPGTNIRFLSSRSGLLTVSKSREMLYLDFPTDTLDLITNEQFKHTIEKCIGIKPAEVYKGRTDYIAFIENEHLVQNMQVDLGEISKLEARGLIVTAPGNSADFVSRFFAPQSGINEDPVTGSAHTSLIPIWAEKLGKKQLTAKQLSKRGGQLYCEFKNERCLIGGKARLYMTGEINLD